MRFPYDQERREFLKHAVSYAITLGTTISGCTTLTAENASVVLLRYTVPNKVREPNIEQIVTALASKKPVGRGSYVPPFVDLVQFVHHELSRMTYEQHMKKELGKEGPIDVVVIRDLYKSIGAPAQFIHGPRNEAQFDDNMGPAYFLPTLNKEMVHAVYGKGETRSEAYNHRDIAYMVARFPDLLRDNPVEDPLLSLMMVTIRNSILTALRGTYVPQLAYLHLLDEKQNPSGAKNLNQAVQFTFQDPEIFKKLVANLKRLKGQFTEEQWLNYLQSLIANFGAKVENYILTKNPRFPEQKKKLLQSRISRIKNPHSD